MDPLHRIRTWLFNYLIGPYFLLWSNIQWLANAIRSPYLSLTFSPEAAQFDLRALSFCFESKYQKISDTNTFLVRKSWSRLKPLLHLNFQTRTQWLNKSDPKYYNRDLCSELISLPIVLYCYLYYWANTIWVTSDTDLTALFYIIIIPLAITQVFIQTLFTFIIHYLNSLWITHSIVQAWAHEDESKILHQEMNTSLALSTKLRKRL